MLDLLWNIIKDRKIISSSGCWLYTGDICPSTKYGRVSVKSKRYHVHRISCAYNHRLNLDNKDEFACHKCPNKHCFNPEHLYSGCNKSNQNDVWNNRCKFGHVLSGGINSSTGRRFCRICNNRRTRKNYQIRKAAKAVNRKAVVTI